jgi:hypothetical protein
MRSRVPARSTVSSAICYFTSATVAAGPGLICRWDRAWFTSLAKGKHSLQSAGCLNCRHQNSSLALRHCASLWVLISLLPPVGPSDTASAKPFVEILSVSSYLLAGKGIWPTFKTFLDFSYVSDSSSNGSETRHKDSEASKSEHSPSFQLQCAHGRLDRS